MINADPRVTFEAAGLPADTALHSAMVCPLHLNDTFIGCLALYHVEAGHYTEEHRRLLERIAEQAGPVIHNSIVFEQTQEDSLTDPLTGLPNRRSMFVHLSRELSRAERLKGEVALIVMDVDGFKAINDTYGHSVGDHALREMANALQGELRPYDLCVRYAGDEFIVVLADCPREQADLKVIELQARVNQIELEVRAGKRLRLAVSAGASVFPHDGRPTKRCSQTPISGCTATRPRGAATPAPQVHLAPEFLPTEAFESANEAVSRYSETRSARELRRRN